MELAIDQKGALKNILIEQNSNTVGTTILVTNNSITKRLMFTQHDKKLSATAMWCRETPEIDINEWRKMGTIFWIVNAALNWSTNTRQCSISLILCSFPAVLHYNSIMWSTDSWIMTCTLFEYVLKCDCRLGRIPGFFGGRGAPSY